MQKNRKIILVSILIMLACAGIASASIVVPDVVTDPKNPKCDDVGIGFQSGEYKIDIPPESLVFDDNLYHDYWLDLAHTHKVSIKAYHVPFPSTIGEEWGESFDWMATFPVEAVIVKGGPNSNVYDYPAPVTSDTFLHAPLNPNNDNNEWYQISHIEFCLPIVASEFPSWFISLTGIAGLVGMLVVFHRK